jgi:hypothetical protein
LPIIQVGKIRCGSRRDRRVSLGIRPMTLAGAGPQVAQPSRFPRRRPCLARNTGALLVPNMPNMPRMGLCPRSGPTRAARSPVGAGSHNERGRALVVGRSRAARPSSTQPSSTQAINTGNQGPDPIEHFPGISSGIRAIRSVSRGRQSSLLTRLARMTPVTARPDDAGSRRGWHGPADVVPLGGEGPRADPAHCHPTRRWARRGRRPGPNQPVAGGQSPPIRAGTRSRLPPGYGRNRQPAGIRPQKLATRCHEVPLTGRGATRRTSSDAQQSLSGSSRGSVMLPWAPVSPDPTCRPQNAHRSGSKS